MSKRLALIFSETQLFLDLYTSLIGAQNIKDFGHNFLGNQSYIGVFPKVSLELKFSWGLPRGKPQRPTCTINNLTPFLTSPLQ